MSQYGSDPNQPDPNQQSPGSQPSANPYGEPNPYGQAPPPPNPYGEAPAPNPYGAPVNPYGQAPVNVPTGGYASWLKRVGASILDALCAILAGIPLWIGYGILIANTQTTTNVDGTTHTRVAHAGISLLLILVGVVTYAGFWIWNVCIRQGRTGFTIGKGTMGIRLLDEPTGQPVGALMSFLRQIVHIVDGICYVGYLWPLWDAKKQTFADKIMHTVVVNQPERS
jgi:uncharacterized RDD family membrane protein YckC